MIVVKNINRVRWVAKIGFVFLFIVEKLHCFESLEVNESTFLKYFKTTLLIIFIIASIIESKLIVKGKNKEIEALKARLSETIQNKSSDVN